MRKGAASFSSVHNAAGAWRTRDFCASPFPFLSFPFLSRGGNALLSVLGTKFRGRDKRDILLLSSVPRKQDDRRDGRYATPAVRMKNDERAHRIVSYRISLPLLSLNPFRNEGGRDPNSDRSTRPQRRHIAAADPSCPLSCPPRSMSNVLAFRPKVTITVVETIDPRSSVRGTRPFVTRSGCLVPS